MLQPCACHIMRDIKERYMPFTHTSAQCCCYVYGVILCLLRQRNRCFTSARRTKKGMSHAARHDELLPCYAIRLDFIDAAVMFIMPSLMSLRADSSLRRPPVALPTRHKRAAISLRSVELPLMSVNAGASECAL